MDKNTRAVFNKFVMYVERMAAGVLVLSCAFVVVSQDSFEIAVRRG
jgi:hypothetical protein